MSHTVRFSRLESGKDGDLQVLVSETHERSSNTKEKRRSNIFLTILYTLFASVILLTSTFLVTYFVTFDQNQPSPYRGKPMVAVNKVIIYVSKAENMTCSDHDSCDDLRRRIERHDGMRYNFVIGSGMELFVGLGFKFHPEESNETALYIKVFMDGTPAVATTSERCWCMANATRSLSYRLIFVRISEIVQQGTVCGKIKKNSTMTVICGDTSAKCPDLPVNMTYAIYDMFYKQKYEQVNNITSVAGEEYKKLYDHYDPDPELGTILMHDFRLLTCERPTHGRRTVKSKVITLKSVVAAPCEPFRPVDRVRVDFERAPPLYCHISDHYQHSNSGGLPCSNLSRLIERDHDKGADYNFILGTHHDLYVGLGFSCRAPPDHVNGTTPETLRIKVLRTASGDGYFQLHRLYELIREGTRCGWISSNYSLALDCDCFLEDYLNFVEKLSHTRIYYLLAERTLDETHRGKVIHRGYRWKMCNHTTGGETDSFPRTVHFTRSRNTSTWTHMDERGRSTIMSSDKLDSSTSDEMNYDSLETGSSSEESDHYSLPSYSSSVHSH